MAFEIIDNSYDFDNYRYEVYLCENSHPYNIIGCITESITDRNLRWIMREPDEFTFTIHEKYEDGTENSYFDSIIESSVIRVEAIIEGDFGDSGQDTYLYNVSNVNLMGGTSNSKNIKAYSLEIRMNKKTVRDFNFTTNIYTGTGWDSNNPENSGIVDYLLSLFEGNWDVLSISPSLQNSLRTFDITNSRVLEVVRLIEKEFNCFFLFATSVQRILIYDSTDFITNSGIILDSENYLNQYTSQINVDDIVTRLYIEGNDGSNILSVNVMGTTYIDDFSFFKNTKYMTQGLIDALDAIDALKVSNDATYQSLLTTLSTKQGELLTLQNELFTLNTELIVLEDSQDLAIRNGGTYNSKTYAQWATDISNKQAEIATKEGEITTKESEIDSTNSSIDNIHFTVSYDNPANLSTAQKKELVNFIQEDSQTINSDDPSTLLALGQQYLALKSKSQYEITIDMIDLFSAKSESQEWIRLSLFNKVNLVIGDDIFEPYITSITHAPDSNSLSVTVSNKDYLNDDMDYLTSLWATTNRVAKIVDKNETEWKETVDKANTLETNASNPIDVKDNVINIGDEGGLVQQAQITRRGLYTGDSLTANGQMRILSDMIVFTQDNWVNYSVAIDSTGIRTSGSFRLISDGIYGGNNLVTINGNGIKIYGDETDASGIEIYNKLNQKVMGFDSSGNLTMTGQLVITSGSSGISNLTDAGALATADDLDDVNDGITYKRTNQNEKTGAGRAYSGLDSSNDLVTRVKPSVSMGNPNISGLYMGSDYIGFHNGNGLSTGWTAYIRNNGQFSFKGDGSNYVEWNGSTLTVRGTLTADDITSGTLTGRTVRTASSGARIEMTNSDVLRCYNSSNQLHGLYIDPGSVVDLALYKNGSKFFEIYDGVTQVELKTYGTHTMLTNNGSSTFPLNTWNFSSTTVVGLSVKFA